MRIQERGEIGLGTGMQGRMSGLFKIGFDEGGADPALPEGGPGFPFGGALFLDAPLLDLPGQGHVSRVIERSNHRAYVTQRRSLDAPLADGTTRFTFKINEDKIL